MTTAPVALRFGQSAPLGIGASIALGAAVGLLCPAADIPASLASPLVAGMAGLPAAIELTLQSRHRDLGAEAARIRQRDLRRPIGLVVILLAVGLSLAVSVVWTTIHIVRHHVTSDSAAGTPGSAAGWILAFGELLILVVLPFPFGWYASHYLGKHPYRWTSVAVGCAAVYSLLMLEFKIDQHGHDSGLVKFFLALWLTGCGLFYCLLGVGIGRNHQARFLAKKLARVERKIAREAAKQSAPKLVTPVSNPFEEIEKLGHLRDTGLLTQEEFQAKKSEILCRI
jgi:hypothetical protein